MSQKCPYFFSQCNNPILKTSDFLENMLSKMNKDKPTVVSFENHKLIIIVYFSRINCIEKQGAYSPWSPWKSKNLHLHSSKNILEKWQMWIGNDWRKLNKSLFLKDIFYTYGREEMLFEKKALSYFVDRNEKQWRKVKRRWRKVKSSTTVMKTEEKFKILILFEIFPDPLSISHLRVRKNCGQIRFQHGISEPEIPIFLFNFSQTPIKTWKN